MDTRRLIGMVIGAAMVLAKAASAAGPFAYIANSGGFYPTDNTVSVIDTSTNQVVKTITFDPPDEFGNYLNNFRALAMSPSGKRVYVADHSLGVVDVIDTSSNSKIAEIPVGNYPTGIAVNSSGTQVYTTNDQYNSITIIDAVNNVALANYVDISDWSGRSINPFGIAVNLAGTRLYVTNNGSNTVSVIDLTANPARQTASIELTDRQVLDVSRPYGIAVNPAGTRVYVANQGTDNSLVVIDTATNSVIKTIKPGFSGPQGIAVSHDGKRVYVTDQADGYLWVIDAQSYNAITRVFMGGALAGIAINPDGTRAYIASNSNGQVYCFDTVNNIPLTPAIAVGDSPLSIGQFMRPENIFVGGFEPSAK